mmetsp:Transcript_10140/g.15162  ORF Transcript_10140/g.15162 Transcript_10140/m.15162 type:complete len:130 (-) Transcript_10140:38-427(-)
MSFGPGRIVRTSRYSEVPVNYEPPDPKEFYFKEKLSRIEDWLKEIERELEHLGNSQAALMQLTRLRETLNTMCCTLPKNKEPVNSEFQQMWNRSFKPSSSVYDLESENQKLREEIKNLSELAQSYKHYS